MNPIRRRRLLFAGLLLLGFGIAVALVLTALRSNIQHFFSPSDIVAGMAPSNRSFKLGGLVQEGSLQRSPDSLKVSFVVTDRFRQQQAEYTGILPDLFKEGQSVVATGVMDSQRKVFVAEQVLAKHDENYMPQEVADAIARAKAQGDEKNKSNVDSKSP
jgi:cytochrome c-type biogenesis protein CcmE